MESLFKRSVPKANIAELSKLIHGFVKTGKTTLAAQMKVGNKEPLFIATEDGHHSLNVLVENVTSWLQFKALIKKLQTNKAQVQSQCSCIVLDLISDIDQLCNDYVCEQLKIRNLADLDFGRGFTAHKKEFQGEMIKLFDILPLTFIAHSKEKEVTIEGEKIKTQSPNLSTGCLEYINGKVDMVGFIIPSAKTKQNPFITFKPTKMAIAGTRYPHLAKEFELDPLDMAGSYNKINQAFLNK